jgi:hypothetical protein
MKREINVNNKKSERLAGCATPPLDLDEWEDFERDRLTRHLLQTLNTQAIREWLWMQEQADPELAADIATRIKERQLEVKADNIYQQHSRAEINAWIEQHGYKGDRLAWRGRLNRARLRHNEINQGANHGLESIVQS